MTTYTTSIRFAGDVDSAMAMAKSYFVANGFKIKLVGEKELTVTGPGMNSTRQNHIRGVSDATIKFTDAAIAFSGALGGVQSMKKFLYLFPPILGIFLSVFFFIKSPEVKSLGAPLLAISPWIILSPLIVKRIERKTIEAIDTFLHNLNTNI